MKILHISDLHYSEKSADRLRKAMDFLHACEPAMAADLCVISGDVLDAPLAAHSFPYLAGMRAITQISNAMPVHVIYGTASHDHPGSLDILQLIGITSMHPITLSSAPDVLKIPNLPLRICSIPGLNRSDPAYRDIRRIIANMAEPMHSAPSILVAHGSVSGSVTESDYAIVAPDHEFALDDLAASDCDAVMLGHIHKHQSWTAESPTGRPVTIAYAGSVTRLTYGQMQQPGCLLWTVGDGPATFERIEIPGPELYHREYSGPPNIEELQAMAVKINPDDMIRVRYSIDAEHAHTVDKAAIHAIFNHIPGFKLEATINPIQSVRAEKIMLAPTIHGKIRQWAETTGDEHQMPEMTARLGQLESQDDDEIIGTLS